MLAVPRSDACDTLDALAGEPQLMERVVFTARTAGQAARFAEPSTGLSPELRSCLIRNGITALWEHQARAVDALRAGQSIVLATGTASGKTLGYQLPIVESALEGNQRHRAARVPDQGARAGPAALTAVSGCCPSSSRPRTTAIPRPTSAAGRAPNATVLLTNPEMLHVGILPSHARWATFLMRLRYVVVDELHVLRGVFGSHVAHVLRRLRRLCAHYGSDPAFCFTSATIGNPAELASELCGLPVLAIDDDAAPRPGARVRGVATAVARPPHRCARVGQSRDRDVARRASSKTVTRHLRSRGAAAARSWWPHRHAAMLDEVCTAGTAPAVAAYRAGYLADERRELEAKLTSGELGGVVATERARARDRRRRARRGGVQRVPRHGRVDAPADGRAGRGTRRAAAVLVAGDDQLDQWYVRHPSELLGRPAEAAVVNPANPYVARAQIACAAHEMPLTHDDGQWFGDCLDDAVRDLVLADQVKPRAGRMYWVGRRPPAASVGLRSGSSLEYQLVEGGGRLVGTVDSARVFQVAHPGAIYLHQGRQYRVASLDTDGHVAVLEPADDLDEHTQPREDTDITVLRDDDRGSVGVGVAHLGSVTVTHHLVAYQRRRSSTNEIIDTVPLDFPRVSSPLGPVGTRCHPSCSRVQVSTRRRSSAPCTPRSMR